MAQAGQTRSNTRSKGNRLRKPLVVIALLVAAAYTAAAGYMYLNQRSILFKADGELPEPSAVGLGGVDVLTLPMPDGTRLTVWSAPAEKDGAPTVLFFHGQSGNLGDRAERLGQILDSGFGLLAPSYRGYPGSSGQPSEGALISDGMVLYDLLAERGERVVLYGQSLGTGVAAAVADQRPDAELLVLEAPFTATVDVAAERYPWLPVAALMKDHFATRDIIGEIEVPTLIFHGTDDEIVPLHHSEALAALAAPETELFVIPDGTHGDLWSHGLWQTVQDHLP